MGWRFRKSFNPLPGIRLNFSPRGISTSVGAGPARLYLAFSKVVGGLVLH